MHKKKGEKKRKEKKETNLKSYFKDKEWKHLSENTEIEYF